MLACYVTRDKKRLIGLEKKKILFINLETGEEEKAIEGDNNVCSFLITFNNREINFVFIGR